MADELTIPGVAERAARDLPDDAALVGRDAVVSYSSLWHLARVGAAALVDRGVEPGDRVGLLADNSPAWAVANLAILCTGAAVVPLSTRWRDAEIDDVLERARCRVVLRADDVDALTQTRASVAARTDVERRLGALSPDAVSHVQFTAGTTGRPKGALLTHRGMVATTREWVGIVGLRRGDGYPIVNPCSHIGGHKTGLLACMIAGATAHPIDRFDPERLRTLIATERLSFLQGPPAMFQALLDAIDAPGPASVDSVRVAVTGSANIPPALIRRMRDTLGLDAVHAGYGLTEATGVCTMTRADDPLALVTETSGRAIPGVEVRIVAPDDEIEVRGVGVMQGYLDDPDATAAVMRPGGWLATGDVGALDVDGNLSILDRLHDLVIVGGFNVYPAEIERVLTEHPAVAQAAVVGVPDDARGEIPVAFVIATDTATTPKPTPTTTRSSPSSASGSRRTRCRATCGGSTTSRSRRSPRSTRSRSRPTRAPASASDQDSGSATAERLDHRRELVEERRAHREVRQAELLAQAQQLVDHRRHRPHEHHRRRRGFVDTQRVGRGALGVGEDPGVELDPARPRARGVAHERRLLRERGPRAVGPPRIGPTAGVRRHDAHDVGQAARRAPASAARHPPASPAGPDAARPAAPAPRRRGARCAPPADRTGCR